MTISRRCAVLGVVCALATVGRAQAPEVAVAPAAPRELLNSERIQQKFGSYGIEVLASDAQVRVANLYSTELNRRVCRTFAVARYPPVIEPAFAAEHREIVNGGSIGAVFAAHGWRVAKTHLFFGEVEATPRLAELMGVASGVRLAQHAYVLEVAKGVDVFTYAAIVEVHHPDYLVRDDLGAIYGTADAAGREALLAALLGTAAAAMR